MFYCLDRDKEISVLLSDPKIYEQTQKGTYFNYKTIILWIIRTFIQSLVVYYFTLYLFGDYVYRDGHTIDSFSIDMFTYTAVVCIQTLTIIAESNTLTILNSLVIFITFIGYFIIIIIANATPLEFQSVIYSWYVQVSFWLGVLLLSLISLLPIYLYKFIFKNYLTPSYSTLSITANNDSILPLRSSPSEPLISKLHPTFQIDFIRDQKNSVD